MSTIEISMDNLALVASALASETRIKILKLLMNNPMSVSEIAEALDMPVSSTISAVLKLENAQLITTVVQGVKKICHVNYNSVLLHLGNNKLFKSSLDTSVCLSVPIGDYFRFSAVPSCGLLGEKSFIGPLDKVEAFLSPNKIFAKLIWFRQGFLEYRIINPAWEKGCVANLSVSMELCSEFPGYNNNFPSDICLWINNVEVGVWHCGGDYGGRRGIFTPLWWDLSNTQYGKLTTWAVTPRGSFINAERCSDITMNDLHLQDDEFINMRVGTIMNGGINLFGKDMGDYNQDIMVRMDMGDGKAGAEDDDATPFFQYTPQ